MADDPWRVTMIRIGDGYEIYLHVDKAIVPLPRLEAHKLGSALHAASGIDTERFDVGAGHDYLSTACHHELHDRCRRTCKFCDVPCRCECHEQEGAT